MYKLCRIENGVFRSFSTKELGFDLVYSLNKYTIPEHGPIWVFVDIDTANSFADVNMQPGIRYVLLYGFAGDVALKCPAYNCLLLRDYYANIRVGTRPCRYPTTDRYMPMEVAEQLWR